MQAGENDEKGTGSYLTAGGSRRGARRGSGTRAAEDSAHWRGEANVDGPEGSEPAVES